MGVNPHYKRVGCIRDIEAETTSLSEYNKCRVADFTAETALRRRCCGGYAYYGRAFCRGGLLSCHLIAPSLKQ